MEFLRMVWGQTMKYLGTDESGNPKFEWCCDKAPDTKDAIYFLDDGKREYDSDKTRFYIIGKCVGNGKHAIHKIFNCPFCGAPVE